MANECGGETGTGPYTVVTHEDDWFHYIHRGDEVVSKGYPLCKTANRKCRDMNSLEAPIEPVETAELRVGLGDGEVIIAPDLKVHLPPFTELIELEPSDDELAIAAGDIERFPSAARHEWLEDAGAFGLKLLGERTDLEVARKVRVSIGWPVGRKAVGECWYAVSSGDGHREIFVSPALEDGVQIVSTLIHELIHASLPDGAKHGPLFAKPARAVGPLTATDLGEELEEIVRQWVAERGPYPAKAMDRHTLQKKQTTRLLKVQCCNEHEPYVVRMSAGQFERAAPVCGICGSDMELA